jgi:4-hydroxy-3-methylbut-2-enyl diphosphate reductase
MEHARRLAEVIQAEPSAKTSLFEASFAGLYSDGFDPLRDLDKIAVVNQTTLLRNETLHIINFLRDIIVRKWGEAHVADHLWSQGKGDTLCYATQVNQDALQKALELPIDAALVVGGKNSSNTFQLYRVCAEHFGRNAHYIQSEANIRSLESVRHYIFPYNLTAAPTTAEEERPLFNSPVDKPQILLTGGASCPDGIIQQVIHRINSFFPPESIRPVEAILEAFESST